MCVQACVCVCVIFSDRIVGVNVRYDNFIVIALPRLMTYDRDHVGNGRPVYDRCPDNNTLRGRCHYVALREAKSLLNIRHDHLC